MKGDRKGRPEGRRDRRGKRREGRSGGKRGWSGWELRLHVGGNDVIESLRACYLHPQSLTAPSDGGVEQFLRSM